MQDNLIDSAMEALAAEGRAVTLTLRDKTTVTGKVARFDGYVIILEGKPETMVYRHSVLKVGTPAAHTERPAARPETPRPPKTREQRKRPQRQPERPEQKPAQAEQGFASPMADEMLKWLKSQKDGE